jgi:anthranilate synthase component 1
LTEVQELGRSVDLLGLHRLAPRRYPFLLQSTASSPDRGRYDILFAAPGEKLVLESRGVVSGRATGSRFLEELDRWWRDEQTGPAGTGLPFTGGWFLYLGYEMAAEVEPGLRLQADPLLPTAFAVRCCAAVIHDRDTGISFVMSEGDENGFPESVRADARTLDKQQEETPLARTSNHRAVEEPDGPFLDSVKRAREYIAAGDVYQANLSRSWSVRIDSHVTPEHIYESLCAANPGPFAGLVRWNGTTVLSSSPERLLCVRDGIASTRPIAGTRPRSADRNVDEDLSAELFAHPKERAEHVMLIDLERNDLGRVCEAGTVEVDEMMVLESYAHVHHIVSNVRGRLRDDVTPGAAIAAVFPGGTITGCPKYRCMQIIDELEAGPRGAYTGSFGYLNRDGNLDLNILIRTMVMQGDKVTFRAGSGIVADSDPAAELAETRAKAEGMLRALDA